MTSSFNHIEFFIDGKKEDLSKIMREGSTGWESDYYNADTFLKSLDKGTVSEVLEQLDKCYFIRGDKWTRDRSIDEDFHEYHYSTHDNGQKLGLVLFYDR